MVVHVLQGVVLSHKHQVQAEGLEVHDAAALVLLPQFPQEVDRVILALLAEEEVDVAYDGEGEAGGGEGEVAPGAGQVAAHGQHHHHHHQRQQQPHHCRVQLAMFSTS